MSGEVIVKAQSRKAGRKGPARALRRAGRVPGILYGGADAPCPIELDAAQLGKYLRLAGFMNSLCLIEMEGRKIRAIPRALQRDPLRGQPVHIDFLRLGAGAEVDVEVPVRFVNEEDSPGLRRGGVLNIVRRAVGLVCPAEAIPESLAADLSGLEIGDSIHISHIKLPEGVRPTITGRDFTVATLVAPAARRGKEDAEAEEGGEAGEAPEEGKPEDAAPDKA